MKTVNYLKVLDNINKTINITSWDKSFILNHFSDLMYDLQAQRKEAVTQKITFCLSNLAPSEVCNVIEYIAYMLLDILGIGCPYVNLTCTTLGQKINTFSVSKVEINKRVSESGQATYTATLYDAAGNAITDGKISGEIVLDCIEIPYE